ncbi:MAG: histidine triad nucleotide-binding protein [Clostridiales bacterium]|jgi:histidine triad (HIT) family protein|nr:histidine triad nucleotide-binding protein [Clostridiales bacterium]
MKTAGNPDCLFCKIASGEIPSESVYSDELVYAFKDIDPKAPVHILVIPKEHIVSAAEISPENSKVISRIFEVIAHLSKELGLDRGFRVVTNCGGEGGQTVYHLHFHLMAGRPMKWPPG